MVGSGILIGPSVMAAVAGNASFIVWLIVAALFLPIVLSTVQLSRMCPGSGGFYAYAKEGLNKRAGYASGWLYITGYTFAVAMEVLALRKPLAALGAPFTSLVNNPVLYNACMITAIVAINLLSLKLFSRLLNSLTISKMIPLVTLILLIPFILNPSFTITGQEIAALPNALPLAIFGYFGFEYCCSISHLVENSERNAPLAILIGFVITASLYTLFHFGVLNLMGSDGLQKFGASAFAEFINLPIPYLKQFLMVLIPIASVITIFAAGAGLLNANAVMTHAMAEEKLFYFSPLFAQMTSWYRPWFTILAQGVVVFIIVTLLPLLNTIALLCIMGVFLSFILPFISLIKIQKRMGKTGKIPLTVLALLIVIGLVIYCLTQLGSTFVERALYLLPLIAFLVVGAVLYRYEPSHSIPTRQ